MQHDLNLTTKKFEAFFQGVGTTLQTDQPLTPGCHVVIHEHNRGTPTGRWVRIAVVGLQKSNLATVRTISRSQTKGLTRAA